MKRLVRKASSENDCMTIIEEFLEKHVKNYSIEYFNTEQNNDVTNISLMIILSDNIRLGMQFTCKNNMILNYVINSNNDNVSIEDTKEIYQINQDANEFFEDKIMG